MSKTKLNRIKASLSTTRLTDEPLLSRLQTVFDAMNGSPDYPKPPVELPVFKAKIDSFASKIGAALDGSKKAKAERDRERHEAVKMYESLGHYAQANCNDDLATFLKSGFSPVSFVRTAAQPLASPNVRIVEEGNNSGELLVGVAATSKARSHELRYAALNADGVPGSWTTISLGIVRSKVSVSGLKPGTTYAFQARALGVLGFTDWSDSGYPNVHLTRIERRSPMNVLYEILRTLGRIEGELIEIRKLSKRVAKLEKWQSWLKGGLAGLTAAYAYLFRQSFGK